MPGVEGHKPNPVMDRSFADAINKAYAPFKALVPERRSHQSQMSYHEPDWQEVSWGEKYERLLSIKRRYDPTNLFFGHHCVGSENWSPDGFEQLS
jgi:FAD/FMN-containing dehydrogenase